jgi:predicted nucleic acid-binding protein
MQTGSTYIDVNVLLEALISTRPKHLSVLKFLSSSSGVMISTLSIHIFVYFALKEGFDLNNLNKFISKFIHADLLDSDTVWAFANCNDKDFEDALQVSIALRNNCSNIVTLDKKLAKNYSSHINIKLL